MNESPPESGGEEKKGALKTLCFHGLRLSESTRNWKGGECVGDCRDKKMRKQNGIEFPGIHKRQGGIHNEIK